MVTAHLLLPVVSVKIHSRVIYADMQPSAGDHSANTFKFKTYALKVIIRDMSLLLLLFEPIVHPGIRYQSNSTSSVVFLLLHPPQMRTGVVCVCVTLSVSFWHLPITPTSRGGRTAVGRFYYLSPAQTRDVRRVTVIVCRLLAHMWVFGNYTNSACLVFNFLLLCINRDSFDCLQNQNYIFFSISGVEYQCSMDSLFSFLLKWIIDPADTQLINSNCALKHKPLIK